MEHTNMPAVGDRVKVVTAPHNEGHDEGIVRQVVMGAMGIEFDSEPGNVHQWYVPSEVMVTEHSEHPSESRIDQLDPLNRHKLLVSNWQKTHKRRFEAKVNKEHRSAEIYLYGEIGEYYEGGVSAARFEQALAELGDVNEITVHIDSPGGAIHDGMTMYNALLRHPAKIITNVVGMAASAAAFLLQAGDERRMGETTKTMIHNAIGVTIGNRIDHRKVGDILEKYDITIANLFAKRSGRRSETWRKMMDDETYFLASEALEHRLIDVIVPAKGSESKSKNKMDLSDLGYAKAPSPQDEPIAEEQADKAKTSPLPVEIHTTETTVAAAEEDASTTVATSAPAIPVASTEQTGTIMVPVEQAIDPKFSAEAVATRLRMLELECV